MTTPNETIVAEQEEKKENERFQELNKIPETERNDEQKKELGELKERYGKRMQKKIDHMTFKTKSLEDENEQLRIKLEELKNKESEEREPEPAPVTGFVNETKEVAGKKWFTDKALSAQIKNNQITEEEAYNYQQKRNKEEIKEELRQEHLAEERKNEEIKLRKEDSDRILRDYPHFNKSHPDFNPNDPLYKLANELYTEGYYNNPRGFTLAIKRAKEILRIVDDRIDRSEDFEVEGSLPPERRNKDSEKDVILTEYEKEQAIRIYTRGDIKKPGTDRPYTENEAMAKALAAKKSRSVSKRVI